MIEKEVIKRFDEQIKALVKEKVRRRDHQHYLLASLHDHDVVLLSDPTYSGGYLCRI